jgi:transporter family protein
MDSSSLFISLLIALLWGLSPILHKSLLKKIHPLSLMLFLSLGYFLCLLLLLPFQYKRIKSDVLNLTTNDIKLILISATITSFLANFLFYYVLKSNNSSIVAALGSTSPLFTLLIAYFLMTEKVNSYGILGIIFIVMGVICISVNDRNLNEFFINRQ